MRSEVHINFKWCPIMTYIPHPSVSDHMVLRLYDGSTEIRLFSVSRTGRSTMLATKHAHARKTS